jgi:hypothetical protein
MTLPGVCQLTPKNSAYRAGPVDGDTAIEKNEPGDYRQSKD